MESPGFMIENRNIAGLTPMVHDPDGSHSSQRAANSWGDYRTNIEHVFGPLNGRDADKFFIHGGNTPGSHGCIDLVGGNNDFHEWFKANGQPLRLTVKLTCNPWKKQ